MKDGASITNDGEALIIKYPDGRTISFDYKIKTAKGFVMAAIIRPIGIDDTISESDLKNLTKKKFHEMSTHQWEGVLNTTTRMMGYKLTGGIGHCDHCIRGKTQRKPTSF